jgi:DNA excision repair protein ERCC-2
MASEINLFPHEKIRDGQEQLISDIKQSFLSQKILLAHAPTGLGKTAASLSVALQIALEQKKVIFFLTNRHTQHQIAVDTLKKIRLRSGKEIKVVDLIGKRWMCSQDIAHLFGNDFNEYCKSVSEKGECEFYNNVRTKNTLQVEAKAFLKELEDSGPLHNSEIISSSKEKKMCGYEIALALGKKADILIGDYNYLFNPFVQATLLNRMDKELKDIIVIVDEAHNLPARIMDMLSNNLTTFMLKNSLLEAKKYGYSGLIGWVQDLSKLLVDLADFPSSSPDKELIVTKESFLQGVKSFVDYDNFIEELEFAAEEVRRKQKKSYLGGLASFLQSWKGEDLGFVRILAEQSNRYGNFLVLKYVCLDPSIISRDIFSQVHSGLLMSGTLQPLSMYSDLLGIGRNIEKEYLSPFPDENKLKLIIPETSTKYTLRSEKMYQSIASHCTLLAEKIPGNVAFFFPSYHLRDAVAPYLNCQKKRFFENSEMNKEEKEALLEEFKANKDQGGLLLAVTGANFAEGIDLPGDLLNGVVVVGLPLAKPDLQTKKLIEYYDHKFGKGWDYGYTFPAFSKCIQSAGRCIRSETDKGAVIFLDERFAWPRYFECFPERIGLKVIKDYASEIEKFFLQQNR